MSAASPSASFVPAEYEWLLLRFAADRESRAPSLLAKAQESASRHAPLRVLDLGAGSGANLLYLAPRLPARAQAWTLIDRDTSLVARVEACFAVMAGRIPDMELHAGELRFADRAARYALKTGDFLADDSPLYQEAWDLVVANAVFDLLSHAQLGHFFDLVTRHWQSSRPPMYFTINLDENIAFTPRLPEDGAVATLFHAHMQRQQSFGRALGPKSAEAILRLAEERGLRVLAAPSPWQIGAGEAPMLHANLDFVDHAVHEMLSGIHGPAAAPHDLSVAAFRRWLDERRAQVERGELTLLVGHEDAWITWQ